MIADLAESPATTGGDAVTAPVVAFLITWFSWRWSFVLLAGLSAVVFGRILDLTGSRTMPFAVSIALLFAGIVTTARIKPDRPVAADRARHAALA